MYAKRVCACESYITIIYRSINKDLYHTVIGIFQYLMAPLALKPLDSRQAVLGQKHKAPCSMASVANKRLGVKADAKKSYQTMDQKGKKVICDGRNCNNS